MKIPPITTMVISAFASSRLDRLAAEVLTAALIGDPFYAAITLDAIDRHEALTKYFEYSLWEGRQLGRVVIPIGDPPGAAIWAYPATLEVAASATHEKQAYLATVLGQRGFAAYRAIIDFMEPTAQAVVPEGSWYLSILGVAPSQQGRGWGRTLLEPTLQQADVAGAVCYLETYNAASLRFYTRLGFRIMAEHLEPTINARYWIMLREPHPLIR